MSDLIGNLLTEEGEIKSVLSKRGKGYIEKTISGKTRVIREEKAKLEADDEGWEILRRNKKSFRLKKDKPLDEQLEDEVWCILAKMGFDELSDGRDFTIKDGNLDRQIDVFAKDRETAIVVECTQCEDYKRKDISDLINKIAKLKGGTSDSIKEYYGNEPKLKIRWVIAIRNIEVTKSNKEIAEQEKIVILDDNDLNYYSKLAKRLKDFSKYQFLSHLFSDEEISGLEQIVPATRGKMGGNTFYNFLIKPEDLMKISFISHKASRDVADVKTYQRMLEPKRLREIAHYVDEGGQFPTNIVVNIKTKRDTRFDLQDTIGDSAFGTLYLPKCYSACWIIDGQHRLYGYMQSERAQNPHDQTTLPVLAYDKLSSTEEASLFVDINCKQVKVTRRLLNEIYANLTWGSPKFGDRINSLCSRVVTGLNSKNGSPIYDRLILTNKDKTKYRCLTLTSFNNSLIKNRFFGTENNPGPLNESKTGDLEKTQNKAIKILNYYLKLFSESMPEHWKLGDDKGGYLCTNNGIKALLIVLKEILAFIEYNDKIDVGLCEPEDIFTLLKKYIKPLIEYFKTASLEEISLYRSMQAEKGVRKNSLFMMCLINKEFDKFLPKGLAEFLETIDEEGTDDAHSLIDEIQERIFNVVIKTLENNFGKRWWYDGVPTQIRTECSKRMEEEKGIKKREQYFTLIDYKKIAYANWEILNEYFSLEEKGGKNKQLEWLDKLNPIRNITHHREKWPATKEQVRFVREIHNKVIEKFKLPEE
ncbi:MAG: DGQHR domain-containing protein [Candidatus Celaenobacter antarcticus]|nr:DGQHR domain-containing protein [Candidatus Celaenobacter antarcticus]